MGIFNRSNSQSGDTPGKGDRVREGNRFGKVTAVGNDLGDVILEVKFDDGATVTRRPYQVTPTDL